MFGALLAISTLIGGISGAWFLWEKLTPRYVAFVRSRSRSATKRPQVRKPEAVPPERRAIAIYCAGMSVFIAPFAIFAPPASVCGMGILFFALSFGAMKLAEKRSEVFESMFLFGSIFAFIWPWLATMVLLSIEEFGHTSATGWLAGIFVATGGSVLGRVWARAMTSF
jgi:hypothetical protein